MKCTHPYTHAEKGLYDRPNQHCVSSLRVCVCKRRMEALFALDEIVLAVWLDRVSEKNVRQFLADTILYVDVTVVARSRLLDRVLPYVSVDWFTVLCILIPVSLRNGAMLRADPSVFPIIMAGLDHASEAVVDASLRLVSNLATQCPDYVPCHALPQIARFMRHPKKKIASLAKHVLAVTAAHDERKCFFLVRNRIVDSVSVSVEKDASGHMGFRTHLGLHVNGKRLV